MVAPTLINLPPPPSDPATPSEWGPGTPGSTTTQMSELSTVAIKDGHRGHPHHHHAPDLRSLPVLGSNTLDAERADRISRLAGLERMSAVRQSSTSSIPPGASAAHPQGYFENSIPPQVGHSRSTVGSASATGSVGGRTTSDMFEHDKMSEDMDTSSMGGFSDEGNASLVGFGEGASSTVSGPTSSERTPQRQGQGGLGAFQVKAARSGFGGPTSPKDVKMSDGMPYDDTNTTGHPHNER